MHASLVFFWLLESVLISIFSLYSVFYHNCVVIAHVPYCTLHMKLLYCSLRDTINCHKAANYTKLVFFFLKKEK